MEMILSRRISELRKKRNLTQEGLGKLLGVSAQAVSKWENGGAPDVELLPALADALGVTMDSLFGRTNEAAPDMEKVMFQHIIDQPIHQRMERLSKLIWVGMEAIICDALPVGKIEYTEKCYVGENKEWLRSVLEDDYGTIIGCPSKEMHFFMVMPEPEKGYAAYLDGPEDTRELLGCLSRPGRLEVLMWVYTKKPHAFMFNANAVSVQCGMSPEQAEACLADLVEHKLLDQETVDDGTGEMNIYHMMSRTGLLPFLMMCKWINAAENAYAMGLHTRKKPRLRQLPKGVGANEDKKAD